MSVIYVERGTVKEPFKGWTQEDTERMLTVGRCLTCGKNLWERDFLYWTGDRDFGLHPDCALHLIHGLLRDIMEVQNIIGHRKP